MCARGIIFLANAHTPAAATTAAATHLSHPSNHHVHARANRRRRRVKLVSLATDKFIAGIVHEAKEVSFVRASQS